MVRYLSCFFLLLIGPLQPVLAAGELNLLVWCDHTDPALLKPFEDAHDVHINVKEYEGTGTALALLEQSQPGDWDVFVVDSVDVPRVAKAGWLAELNRDDFPWDDIFPQLHAPDLHRVNDKLYAIPEKFGYNTLAYNRDKVDIEDMRETSVLWNPKYRGRIAIYDYYIPLMEMVAIGLGMIPSEISIATLPQIKERLFEMKALAATVGDVVSVQTALATGEVDIIAGGGEYAVAGLHAENPALDWILPDDGGIRWMQAIGVFKNSKRQDLAVQFVQWVLSPEGQARLATSSCYWAMPANSKAALSNEQKQILRWDEQPDFIANSFPYYIPDEKLDAAMLDVWTEFLQYQPE
jgi:spermidine/putrescine transport system substrate-binding protein